ncbi:hypothetical protein MRB53_038264 [Persea americana]|nr:hypothetical protein MRB53_038264 [Persea americana]
MEDGGSVPPCALTSLAISPAAKLSKDLCYAWREARGRTLDSASRFTLGKHSALHNATNIAPRPSTVPRSVQHARSTHES